MRAIVVALAFLYVLAFGIPTTLYLAGYYGRIGFVRAGQLGPVHNGNVTTVASVRRGSPAARAGIVPGDQVVRAAAEHAPPFEQLFDLMPAGHPITYAVVHDGQSRFVAITPYAIHPAPASSGLIVALLMRGAAVALIGALLVLLRPSIMTAALYILCLEFAELAQPFGNLELVSAVPLFWKPFFLALTCIITGGGPAVAAIFCMRFPSGEPLRSWRTIEKAMVVVGIATAALYLTALYAGSTYSELGSRLYGLFSAVVWLCYAVAVAAFIVRYANSSGEDRARLRWVAIGLGSFLISYALFWYSQNDPNASAELSWWAQFVNVLPFAVLYAIVRHRVIDVRIAGGRAIAFAVLSAIPVIAFSLIDWGLSNRLQSSKLAAVAEICLAIGFGFWVNSMQRRIDGVIESVFFRKRRIAEERLRQAARRFAHESDQHAIDATLVGEPYEAMHLVATALYVRAGAQYARVAERAWPDDVLPNVDANDNLVLDLATTGEAIDITATAWQGAAGIGAVRPCLAVPIGVRRNTTGFLLLGEKRDGERFDAFERSALNELAAEAANAYDHLDAEEQRRVADDLRGALEGAIQENDTLRALLQRAPSSGM